MLRALWRALARGLARVLPGSLWLAGLAATVLGGRRRHREARLRTPLCDVRGRVAGASHVGSLPVRLVHGPACQHGVGRAEQAEQQRVGLAPDLARPDHLEHGGGAGAGRAEAGKQSGGLGGSVSGPEGEGRVEQLLTLVLVATLWRKG